MASGKRVARALTEQVGALGRAPTDHYPGKMDRADLVRLRRARDRIDRDRDHARPHPSGQREGYYPAFRYPDAPPMRSRAA
ncbi:MAG: hypothetical protein JWQ95_2550 [Sphaerisporangium sp.]|nr:hypothetical protein [Sphaerisporangium sp.]